MASATTNGVTTTITTESEDDEWYDKVGDFLLDNWYGWLILGCVGLLTLIGLWLCFCWKKKEKDDVPFKNLQGHHMFETENLPPPAIESEDDLNIPYPPTEDEEELNKLEGYEGNEYLEVVLDSAPQVESSKVAKLVEGMDETALPLPESLPETENENEGAEGDVESNTASPVHKEQNRSEDAPQRMHSLHLQRPRSSLRPSLENVLTGALLKYMGVDEDVPVYLTDEDDEEHQSVLLRSSSYMDATTKPRNRRKARAKDDVEKVVQDDGADTQTTFTTDAEEVIEEEDETVKKEKKYTKSTSDRQDAPSRDSFDDGLATPGWSDEDPLPLPSRQGSPYPTLQSTPDLAHVSPENDPTISRVPVQFVSQPQAIKGDDAEWPLPPLPPDLTYSAALVEKRNIRRKRKQERQATMFLDDEEVNSNPRDTIFLSSGSEQVPTVDLADIRLKELKGSSTTPPKSVSKLYV
eukprot:m.26768 g.26768  ORF g.26768 m.26768 type:complete len:466 (-) comp7830_c0_seq1:60-1457(-)